MLSSSAVSVVVGGGVGGGGGGAVVVVHAANLFLAAEIHLIVCFNSVLIRIWQHIFLLGNAQINKQVEK